MANVGNTPPQGGSVPRVYYYRTRHYKPELHTQNDTKDSKPLVGEAILKSGTHVKPQDIPPLEGGDDVKGRGIYLSRENLMQLSLCILILLVAISFGMFWFGSTQDGQVPIALPSDNGKPDSRYEVYWTQKMRVIAAEEIRLALAEKLAQINQLIKEIKSNVTSGAPPTDEDLAPIDELRKRIQSLEKEVEVKLTAINGRISSIESKTDIRQQVELLRTDVDNKIKQAIEKAQKDSSNSISQLSAKLEAFQQQLNTQKDAAKVLGDKVSSVEGSLQSIKTDYASKKSVEELKAATNKQNTETQTAVADLKKELTAAEQRIKSWVEHTIDSEFIKREVLKVLQSRPPMEDARVNKLLEDVAGMKVQLQKIVSDKATAPPPRTPDDKPHQPSTPPPQSPHQIVEGAKDEINEWIRSAIADATPDLVKAVKDQLPPQQNLESQKKEIEAWLKEKYLNNEIPGLIESANRKLADSVKGNIDGVKRDLTKLEDRVSKQTFNLDSPTKSLIVKQLRDEGVVKGLTAEEVTKIVEEKVDKFAADRVSMVDYALEAGGARIFRYGTSPNYREGLWHTLAGSSTHSPTVILSPVGSMRGKCWAFAGDHGYVTIQLPIPVKVSSFSLEHIARSLAVTPGSAPRKFQVLGLPSPYSPDFDVLGEYEYTLRDEKTVQTFLVQTQNLPQNATLTYQFIVLSITSNYGHPDFTCVYRFRVHGEPSTEFNAQEAPILDPTS